MLPSDCISTVNLCSTDVQRFLFKDVYQSASCLLADNCPHLVKDLDLSKTSFPNVKLLRISGTSVETVNSPVLESLFVNNNPYFRFTPIPTLTCLSIVGCYEQVQLYDIYQNYPRLEKLFVDGLCKVLGVHSKELEIIRVGDEQTMTHEARAEEQADAKYETLIEQLIMIENE